MSRNLLVVLLMATSVALAVEKPKAKIATVPAADQKKVAAEGGQTEEALAKTKAEQVKADEGQARMDGTQRPSESP